MLYSGLALLDYNKYLTSLKLGTVSFLQHTFHDATTLIKAGNVINERYVLNSINIS